MNGKSIGGMTELGVSVELDACGRELELVVARYRDSIGASRQVAALEQSEWMAFDDAVKDKRRLDWFEMNTPGVGAMPSLNMLEDNEFSPFGFRGTNRESLGFGSLGSPQHVRPTVAQNSFQNQPRGSQHFSLASPNSLTSRQSGRVPQQSRGSKSTRSSDSGAYNDDDEAWLGCVCGEIHPEPIRVFWIQCDDCRSWYNVAPICVGFKELEASSVGSWVCRGCGDSVAGSQASGGRSKPVQQVVIRRGGHGKRLPAVPRPSPSDRNNLFGTPGSLGSKRKSPHTSTATDILEDRKRRKTEDGCFLPLRTPRKKEDGTYARPCGRGPPGMQWDAVRGLYTPQSKSKEQQRSAPSKIVIVPRPVEEEKSVCESLGEKPAVSPANPLPNEKPAALPGDPSRNETPAALSADPLPSARRTEDGCFLPLRVPKKKDDGTYARPCGRAPPGMAWDAIRGLYAPVAPKSTKGAQKSVKSTEGVQKSAPVVPKSNSVQKTAPVCTAPVDLKSNSVQKTTAPCAAPSKTADEQPRPQSEDKSDCQSLGETSVALPVAPSTNKESDGPAYAAATKASAPQRGTREERDAEREKRMTNDGCLIPKSALKTNANGTYARPRGRGPPGMHWDAVRGVFAPPKRKAKSKQTIASPKESVPYATTPAIDAGSGIKPPVTGAGTGIPSVVSPEEEQKVLPVGTLVNVAERVWIGSNKIGGIGTVMNYQETEDGAIFYDVKYSLGGKETGIDGRWVSLHDFSGCGSVMRSSKK